MRLQGSFILLAGLSGLTLQACSPHHPNAMPGGYTYHHEVYKSPNPPPSMTITPPERAAMTTRQAVTMRSAVRDLLIRITGRAGLPPKPVYVAAPKSLSPFYTQFDNDLREAMRAQGYAISDTPENAYIFAYSAMPILKPRGQEMDGTPNLLLSLEVYNEIGSGARLLTEQEGRYFVAGAHAFEIAPIPYIPGAPGQQNFARQRDQIPFDETLNNGVMQPQAGRSVSGDIAAQERPPVPRTRSLLTGQVSKKVDY